MAKITSQDQIATSCQSKETGASWNSLPAELRNRIYHDALIVPNSGESQKQFDGKIDLRCGLTHLDPLTRQETGSIIAGATKVVVCGDNWREQMSGVRLDTLREVEITWATPTGPWKELGELAAHLAKAENLQLLALHVTAPMMKTGHAEQLAEALMPWGLAAQSRLETDKMRYTITETNRGLDGDFRTEDYQLTAVNLLKFVEDGNQSCGLYGLRRWCKVARDKLQEEFPTKYPRRFNLVC